MSKFESFMVELMASADDLRRSMDEARQAADRFVVAQWRLLPWWRKVAHFMRHPVDSVRLIRAAHKAG